MDNKKTHARNVNENPCNMCMPMGGILAFKGIENAMIILHGAQGCATYMRRHIAEHFNEPVDIASSSLNEKGTIFGGEKNLKQGLNNLIKIYNPKLIGVLTTCLAETIGEDIDRITAEYLQEYELNDLAVVPVPTPGYGDSHFEGYWLTLKTLIFKLAQQTEKHQKINMIIPNISPADIREIKRILDLFHLDYIMVPDFSDTLDRPFSRPYKKVPEGGARPEDIAMMPGSVATIQFGLTVEGNLSPGKYLETEYGVPLYNLPIPIGIGSTDCFINALEKITGCPVPDSLSMERGRLLDCMIDSHKYNFHGRSVIFGEPELVYAMTKACLENGIFPVAVATGSKNNRLGELLEPEISLSPVQAVIMDETDFVQIRQKSVEMQANIAMGHSDGRYLEEREGIPLVRMGFPIHDRVGGQRLLSVGYTGTALFLDRITNALLEEKYKKYRKSLYNKYYLGGGQNELRLANRKV